MAAAKVVLSNQNNSSTETVAGPSLEVLQVSPPSSLVNIPISLPKYSQLGLVGLAVIDLIGTLGKPELMEYQEAPLSAVRKTLPAENPPKVA